MDWRKVITGLLLAPVAVAAVWFDQPLPWFLLLVLTGGILALIEFYRLSGVNRLPMLNVFGLAWAGLLIVSPYLPSVPTSVLFSIPAVLSLIYLLSASGKPATFSSWAWMLAGVIYVGWLLSFYVGLRQMDLGRQWVLYALLVTFATDSAAYFTGVAWGRRKLAPRISPGKSWEGAGGGLVAAVLASLLLAAIFKLPLGAGGAVLLGITVGVFGQLGDLVESLFKRNMAVKDSAHLLPGHGGFLDRIDSLLFAGIVVYYFVQWFV